jgi:hypothetical protein
LYHPAKKGIGMIANMEKQVNMIETTFLDPERTSQRAQEFELGTTQF